MSSTTERQRGQALAIFALSFSVVLMAAALAFDVGSVLLERRDEQNAADAAAMAGARYVIDDRSRASQAARDIAQANGFAAPDQVVVVNIPPREGHFAGFRDAVEVKIADTRPSIFAGIAGILDWPVSARAVAAQLNGVGGPWAFLALHPTACPGVLVSGNGDITAYGSIQVDSDCVEVDGGALKRSGNGTITVHAEGAACNVHGEIKNDGKPENLDCTQVEGAGVIGDPLAGIGDPTMPALAKAPLQVAGSPTSIPAMCPGSSKPATSTSPGTCRFNTKAMESTAWRLYPGLYPGGLVLQYGTFYLEPGIYWIGGGGLTMVGGGASVHSVEAGTTTDGGGVLFFNTQLPGSAIKPIDLGGADANVYLEPLDAPESTAEARFNHIVIYQDRDFPIEGDDVVINGSDSDMSVRGLIYVPTGDVKVNGSAGKLTIDQVIGSTFKVDGAPGSQIEALKSEDFVFLFYAAGLVE